MITGLSFMFWKKWVQQKKCRWNWATLSQLAGPPSSSWVSRWCSVTFLQMWCLHWSLSWQHHCGVHLPGRRAENCRCNGKSRADHGGILHSGLHCHSGHQRQGAARRAGAGVCAGVWAAGLFLLRKQIEFYIFCLVYFWFFFHFY